MTRHVHIITTGSLICLILAVAGLTLMCAGRMSPGFILAFLSLPLLDLDGGRRIRVDVDELEDLLLS